LEKEEDINPTPSKKKKPIYYCNVTKIQAQFSWLNNSKSFLYCKVCNIKINGKKFHAIRHAQPVALKRNEYAARTTPKITSVLTDPRKEKTYILIKEAELRIKCLPM
jgi:hypothetical protein